MGVQARFPILDAIVVLFSGHVLLRIGWWRKEMSQRLYDFYRAMGYERREEPGYGAVWHPPTDVYETEDGAVIILEVAGMAGSEFNLIVKSRALVITGTRYDEAEKRVYQQMEIHYGDFRSEIHLPWSVEPGSIEAEYEDGSLRIVVRRRKAERIPVITG
jgi:HSP20 family molecular chaperone IbpA